MKNQNSYFIYISYYYTRTKKTIENCLTLSKIKEKIIKMNCWEKSTHKLGWYRTGVKIATSTFIVNG